ncbi:MAG: aldehyde ferredoxin oxidoreductase C-terminal domain-containing protein, partial [Deltaproteobacteria bacterium]
EKKAGGPTDGVSAKAGAAQEKSEMIKRAMLICIALDCLGLCKIPSLSLIRTFDLSIESELAATLTGNVITPEVLFRMAGSVADLERLFNLRQGATAADDQLPEVFLEKPGESGGPGTTANWLQPLVRDFYRAMGWDDKGVPARERCEQVEIEQSLRTVDGLPPREIQRR